ncbi:MAG: DNA integrity scanning protein DisA nucleotide-binding domain protein, partial [Flavobacteriales bacterium]|nr:DNA integrity scanning protein DisA nucleotide-binding domain protein [Flavobacteriales bacterium]
SACFEMGKTRTGALIVIKKSSLPLIESSVGDVQNIVPTQSILESIFYKNSPLHDGAIVIENGRIVATRVILPVSRNKNLPEEYGTRHRAAVGICEKSDAACIVVSEERGKVTYIKGETIEVMKDEKELENRIAQELEM